MDSYFVREVQNKLAEIFCFSTDFDEINSPQKESNSKIIIAPSVSVAQPARVNWQDPKEVEKIVKE